VLVPACSCWSPLPACSLVLPFVCTRLVLRVRLPSAHVLTRVRSCWSRYLLVRACSLVLPFVCTRLVLRVRLPSAHVLTRVRSCWSRYLLVRACSRPFVCTFVPVFACPAVRVYSLGFAAACLFVLVRARLSGFVCIKYTVSTTSYLRNSPL
jgi:hypothetical protein